MPKLTAEEARRTFRYDPDNGKLYWNVERKKIIFGQIAGSPTKDGYYVGVNYIKVPATHIIWLIVHGRLPIGEIDHQNRNKFDNRLSNLREATRAQNGANRGKQLNNNSGHTGVSWHSRDQKWIAHIMKNKKPIHIGSFSSIEEAIDARAKKAKELFEDFAP